MEGFKEPLKEVEETKKSKKDIFFRQFLSLRLPTEVVDNLVSESGDDWNYALEKYDTPGQFWYDVVQQLPDVIEDP